MIAHRPEASMAGRSSQTLGGARFQCTLAAIAIGSAASAVTGDILDFESLPDPTYLVDTTTGIAYDPLGSYMGFRFSSENFYPPGHPFANVWFDYALTTPPSTMNGYSYGINGARAMGQPMYDIWQPTTWSIEREDLGEWMFGGAQFTRVIDFHPNSVFRIVGWRDGAVVYDINTQLSWNEQLSFGAQVDAIAVDKVVMTHRFTYPSGTVLSTWFTMDDMHYQLVPAPGALVLLSMCALMRHRRRD